MQMWFCKGELQDPFNEFFVLRRPNAEDVDGSGANAYSLFHRCFELDTARAPSFLPLRLLQRMFTVGVSLNFARRCGSTAAIAAAPAAADRSLEMWTPLQLQPLEASLRRNERLVQAAAAAHVRPRLQHHMRAIRLALLFGSGDFGALLAAHVAAARPARRDARALEPMLRTALAASAAGCQFGSDAAEHLQLVAHAAPLLPQHRSTAPYAALGLQYTVGGGDAAAAVLSPAVLLQYGRVSRLLWQLLWADHQLAAVWGETRQAMKIKVVLARDTQQQRFQRLATQGTNTVACARILRHTHSMLYFLLHALRTYVQVRVIAPALDTLIMKSAV